VWFILAGMLPSARGVIGLRQVDGMPHQAPRCGTREVVARHRKGTTSDRHWWQRSTLTSTVTSVNRTERSSARRGICVHTEKVLKPLFCPGAAPVADRANRPCRAILSIMTGDRHWPRYLRVAQLMRQAIGNGVYPTGSALPSIAQLAETYGVPPTVIGAVLRELRSEGLVSGRAGEIISVVDEPGSASSSCLDG
jgi:hypothetical protein